jgi:hypothetical protein
MKFIILFFLVNMPAIPAYCQDILLNTSGSLFSLDSLGACQGVSVINGRIYLYGDREAGILREYEYKDSALIYKNKVSSCMNVTSPRVWRVFDYRIERAVSGDDPSTVTLFSGKKSYVGAYDARSLLTVRIAFVDCFFAVFPLQEIFFHFHALGNRAIFI